jgi:hypothetical protein
MEVYKNVSGEQLGQDGFDPTALASMGLNVVVGTLVGVRDAKKMRQLQEKLSTMSLAQAKEMESLMIKAQSDTDRLKIMYQTFAVLENQNMIDDRKNKQLTLLAVMGGGVLLLIGLGIFFKKRK